MLNVVTYFYHNNGGDHMTLKNEELKRGGGISFNILL